MDIGNLIKKSTIAMEEGDCVGQDGLVHCGKCGTAREYVLGRKVYPDGTEHGLASLNGTVVGCLCRCRAEERDRIERQQRERKKMEKLRDRQDAAFRDSDVSHMIFANDDGKNPKVTELCHKYVDTFSAMQKGGKGIIFYGGVGTGKTFAAMCIVNGLLVMGRRCLATSLTRIDDDVQRAESKNAYIDELCSYDLILLDDLGAERDSSYMRALVSTVIDALYMAKVPMIITTNLSIRELKRPADTDKARVYSRIVERCYAIPVPGTDRRQQGIATI